MLCKNEVLFLFRILDVDNFLSRVSNTVVFSEDDQVGNM